MAEGVKFSYNTRQFQKRERNKTVTKRNVLDGIAICGKSVRTEGTCVRFWNAAKPVLPSRLAFAALFLSLTASAETWLLTTNQKDKYGAADAQYNMQYWTSVENATNGLTSSALVPGDDYLVEKGYQLSLKEGYEFVGNSLTIGSASTGKAGTLRLRGSKVAFPNEGVFLYKGSLANAKYRNNTGVINGYSNLLGKVTVTAPKSAPITFTSEYHNLHLYMDGELIGDSTAGFQIGDGNAIRSNCLFTVNHADRYFGDITVNSGRTNDTCHTFGYGLGLGPSTYPGRIALLTTGALLFSPRAGVTATVNALEFAEKSYLRFYYDPATEKSGFIDVTGSLTLPESPLVVQAEYTPVFSTTGEDVRCAILRGPAGVRLDSAQFVFEPDVKFEPGSGKAPQRLHFEVETDATTDRDTLYAVIEPIIKILSWDGDERGEASAMANGTSLTNALKWGDGRVPHANAHYYVNTYLNSTFGEEDYAFPGRSLIYNNGTFFIFGRHRLSFPVLDVGVMRFRSCQSAKATICGGTLYAKQASVKFSSFDGKPLRIESEIVGNAEILLSGESGTGTHHGIFEFAAFNTNSLGRIYFDAVKDGEGTPNYREAYLTLMFFDERNLGAALPAFMFDAVNLGAYGEVAVTNDVTLLAERNRGIFVNRGGGRLDVAEGATLDCLWPITLDDPLWKSGAGTLALGGAPGFIEDVDGVTNRVETLPEDEAKRLLIVTNGYVKALSPDCVNGLTVSLAQNSVTGLVLDYATEDDTLANYGFRNVKTDTPFIGDTIRVSVVNIGPEAFAASRRGKLGLLTVKTTVADADDLESRLLVTRPSGVISGVLREDDADTGWTTFSMTVRLGFTISIR